MAGLLDFGMDDPRNQGLLALGAGLLNSRGNFGQALGQALPQGMDQYNQAAQLLQRRKSLEQETENRTQQMELLKQKAMEQQREQQRQQQIEDAYRRSIVMPDQQAMQQFGGPTQAAATASQGMAPKLDQQALIRNLMQADPMSAAKLLQPKPDDYKVVGDSLVSIGAGGVKEAYRKPKETDWNQLIVTGPDGKPMLNRLALDAKRQVAQAGASSVSVNTDNLGLKPKDRFEMEQKLSADYGAATKLDRGVISTADDISGILKQGGALKDQAAIYKFAKALDPDGAVREADYAAIVQTAGGLDYVKALVNKALTGEQLLPKQREEMSRVVNAMAEIAKRRIGAAQRKTGANAKLYNLNPENVFTAADNDGWSITPSEGK